MKQKILKLICGAGNENLEEIEKLSFIYSAAGFNMIDAAASLEAARAVKSGILRAGKENAVCVCISLGVNDDIHLSKAYINSEKCSSCGACSAACPQNAAKKDGNKFFIDEKNCIGCAKCIEECPAGAIERIYKDENAAEKLIPLLNENIGCVEFHCTSEDENKIMREWAEIKKLYKGRLSICMNRSKLGDDKIIKLLKEMTSGLKDVIIQADGKPMTGGADDYKSNLQSVSFAQLIKDAGIKADVILSGGANSKTAEFAKLCGIEIEGAALGSYARKLVKEYTPRNDFWENDKIQTAAIAAAKKLADELLKNI